MYVAELVRVVEAVELFERLKRSFGVGSRRLTTEPATSVGTCTAKLSLKTR